MRPLSPPELPDDARHQAANEEQEEFDTVDFLGKLAVYRLFVWCQIIQLHRRQPFYFADQLSAHAAGNGRSLPSALRKHLAHQVFLIAS
jgi:hypothetical protein